MARGKIVKHDAGVYGRFEATTTVFKIPACANCGGANPDLTLVEPGRFAPPTHCKHCGLPLPEIEEIQHVADVTATIDPRFLPWYAKALLMAGKALRTLARRLEK
jgi:hypothetical protein